MGCGLGKKDKEICVFSHQAMFTLLQRWVIFISSVVSLSTAVVCVYGCGESLPGFSSYPNQLVILSVSPTSLMLGKLILAALIDSELMLYV